MVTKVAGVVSKVMHSGHEGDCMLFVDVVGDEDETITITVRASSKYVTAFQMSKGRKIEILF